MKAGAVFDLDGTLLTGTSAERLLARYLWRRGFLGPGRLWAFARTAASLPRRGPGPALRRNKGYLRGLEVVVLETLILDFVGEVVIPRLSPVVLARLEELRASGHVVCLLTGAPHPIAREVGRRLGLADAIGTALEVRDGRYTGRIAGPHYFRKGKLLGYATLAEGHDLDPGRTHAFADHAADLHLLRRVAHPCAVDPDRGLAREAAARGWPVLRQPRTARFTRFSSRGTLKWLKVSGWAPADAADPAASASCSERA